MQWVFLVKPVFFPMISLLCFLVTGFWPNCRRLRRKFKKGPLASSLIWVSLIFSLSFSSYGLRLLHKCKFYHFTLIDSGTVASDFLFESIFVNSAVIASDWQLILPTMFEFEGLVGGKMSTAQAYSRSIAFKCFFQTPNHHSLYYVQTAIRSLQIPLVPTNRFDSCILNSRALFGFLGE